MPENMSEFEKYLIQRIDALEEKLSEVKLSIRSVYSFSAGASFTFGLIGYVLGHVWQ